MIRQYQREDLLQVMDIANRAWIPIYDMYERELGKELADIRTSHRETAKGKQVKRHCENHPDQVLICEEENTIIGFVTFHLNLEKKIGIIGNNAVDPECGLKGRGQQMYQAVFQRFKAAGMNYAEVSTGLDEAHAPARRAYLRAGFERQIESVTYYKKID
jgi:N-acetylglutamate synthase-like GNAT family acetyltransferase